jgi:anti-sigma B factor antagonist
MPSSTPSPGDQPSVAGAGLDPGSPAGRIDVELDPASAPAFGALVVLHGEHDLATSMMLRGVLAPLGGDVLVDLDACEFLDSTIIGVLLERLNRAKAAGSRFELVVSPENGSVTRIVEVVGMRSLLPVHDQRPGSTD